MTARPNYVEPCTCPDCCREVDLISAVRDDRLVFAFEGVAW